MNEKRTSISIFIWLTKRMTRRSKLLMGMASLVSMSGGFIISYIPKTIGHLLDSYNNQRAVTITLVVLAGLYLISESAIVFRRLIVEKIATNLFTNLTVEAATKILHLDMEFVQMQKSGSINSKVQSSVTGSTRLVKLFFMDLIPSFFIMLFAIIFAFYQSIIVGLVLLLIIPINILVIVRQLKSQRGVRVGLIRSQEEIQGNIIEMITGIEETRVSNFENEQIKKIQKTAKEISEKEFRHHKGMIKFDFTKGTLKWVFHIVILAISVYMAFNNYLTIGNVLTNSLLFMASMKPIEEIHRYLDELQENSIKAYDLKDIYEHFPIDNSFLVRANLMPVIKDIENVIKITNLTFQYKLSSKKAFEKLNLLIEKGNYVGIVGESGCGKSSLIKNILKIQQGNGKIWILGYDLSTMTRQQISELIMYVPQTPFIFNGTLRENMSFGYKGVVSDELLQIAAEKACLLNLIENLPKGFDTMITERGTNLSGGERQRICLARVFVNYHKPVIVLDEATSSMDNKTEAKIYDNLLASGKTIISIAHRLNTLLAANKIIVMNNSGQVVQQGTYNELIKTEDIFSRLAKGHSKEKK